MPWAALDQPHCSQRRQLARTAKLSTQSISAACKKSGRNICFHLFHRPREKAGLHWGWGRVWAAALPWQNKVPERISAGSLTSVSCWYQLGQWHWERQEAFSKPAVIAFPNCKAYGMLSCMTWYTTRCFFLHAVTVSYWLDEKKDLCLNLPFPGQQCLLLVEKNTTQFYFHLLQLADAKQRKGERGGRRCQSAPRGQHLLWRRSLSSGTLKITQRNIMKCKHY